MKQLVKRYTHKFLGHKWKKTKNNGVDYSEPRERTGDYLPTQWKEFSCNCGTKKRIYHDALTHLGVSDDRIFIWYGAWFDYKHLQKETVPWKKWK